MLAMRAALLDRLRAYFRHRGFLEVETPLLASETVVDRHIDPLSVKLFDDPRFPDVGATCWLQTSPELHMKRLLAAGGKALFQVTRAFRGGERGRLHNVEFTIVEWYRVGDSMRDGMQLLSDLTEELLGLGPSECITYAESFQQYAGLDPHASSIEELASAAGRLGIAAPTLRSPQTSPPSHDLADRDEWLNLLLAECVEPHLGQSRPTILYHYPASQAALSRVVPGDPPLAERFELYVRGIELANGYHELLDADELRRRGNAHNEARAADGKYVLPQPERLLAAMEHGLPSCTGVALGFDRLVMVAAGASSLAEVMPFPIDRA
jgi:lysyl-tRNA synthetase class 2